MLLTTVTGTFSADHMKPYGDARHGHDWHVEAEVPAAGHKEQPQAHLDRLLGQVEGSFLDDLLESPTNEGVAQWLGAALGADRVAVWRFDRGRKFGGVWRA